MTLDQPSVGELEVSIFGPGYGEAIAVHVGCGDWLLVDSCLQGGEPASLVYLRSIGVDVRRVTAVIATHWHDDHVRGLCEVVRACTSARVCLSGAVSNHQFLVLARQRLPATRVSSGTREMCEVVELLQRRKLAGDPRWAPERVGQRTVVYRSPFCEVMSLSPSPASVDDSMASFAQMAPVTRQEHRRVVTPKPNAASVALWIGGTTASAVLGADLEADQRADRGWSAALDLAPAERGKAALIKVPHHGSVTGHSDGLWDELLEVHPAALLTPFQRGSQQLPTADDRDRLCRLAPEALIVGTTRAKVPRYPQPVERTLREATLSRRLAIGHMGHARARSGPEDGGAWRVEPVVNATRLCPAA